MVDFSPGLGCDAFKDSVTEFSGAAKETRPSAKTPP
jgi:hypothetical protein